MRSQVAIFQKFAVAWKWRRIAFYSWMWTWREIRTFSSWQVSMHSNMRLEITGGSLRDVGAINKLRLMTTIDYCSWLILFEGWLWTLQHHSWRFHATRRWLWKGGLSSWVFLPTSSSSLWTLLRETRKMKYYWVWDDETRLMLLFLGCWERPDINKDRLQELATYFGRSLSRIRSSQNTWVWTEECTL